MDYSLLIKPASADCNLRCSYCFYLPKGDLYPTGAPHRMTDAVLDRMIATYMGTAQSTYIFGWQGGEPTLMGVPFFRRVVELQARHGRPGAVVGNALQTNATLVTPELAGLLAEFRFLVGVSIDGPAEVHDAYRRSAGGAPSHRDVLRGLSILQRHHVECNALVVVSGANAGHPREVYRFLKNIGLFHHQYIPCVERDSRGRMLPWSVTAQQWGEFLCGVFGEWIQGDAGTVSVRQFDAALSVLQGGEAGLCTMGRACRGYLLVEHNGDVFPCDFYVEPSLRLGNIATDAWEHLHRSALNHEFGARKRRWGDRCQACRWLKLCAGDCPRNRPGPPIGEPSLLCDGWRRFFEEASGDLARLAAGHLGNGAPPGQVPRPLPI